MCGSWCTRFNAAGQSALHGYKLQGLHWRRSLFKYETKLSAQSRRHGGALVDLAPQIETWKFSLPGDMEIFFARSADAFTSNLRCIHFKPPMHSLQTSDAFTSNLRCIHFKPPIAETYLVTQRLFAKKLQKVRSSATSIPRNHCFDWSVAYIPIINNCRRMTQRNTKIIKTFQ